MTSRIGRSARSSASLIAICAALAAGGAAGCHGQRDADDPSDQLPALPAKQVSDAEFAGAVHRLLREGEPTAERSALLAGTVKRQLAHAAELFERKDAVRGADAVVGAMYLVRTGELRDDMFDARSLVAIDGALQRFGALGDEGRAVALMLLESGLVPPQSPKHRALDAHRAALERWIADTRPAKGIQRLGAEERAAVGRALLDPSDAARHGAEKAINRWVQRAIEINLAFQRTRQTPARGDVIEAYRALHLGSETLAALYLHHGHAPQALEALEHGAAGRVIDVDFFARLRGAAIEDTAEDWRLLARAFSQRALDDEDVEMDQALVNAALWGISIEAFRRDPTSFSVAHLLSDQLAALGMVEVAPLVLNDALGPDPTPVALSGVLAVVSDALNERLVMDDAKTARRIFAAAAPLLAVADGPRFRKHLRPSPPELRRLMAGIELAAGKLDAALPLLRKALQAEPSVDACIDLAMLDRQAGDLAAALSHAERALHLDDAPVMPLRIAEARLLLFEILRDQGDLPRATKSLDEALALALDVRKRGAAKNRLRAERLLAHVLDSYGDRANANRAMERALELATGEPGLLGETLRDAIGRALVVKDVKAARAALQLAMNAADPDDLTYAAVWLMLLERELAEPPDGKAERVLLDAVNQDGWIGTLARWARAIATDAELRAAAKPHARKVEAEFYIAMRQRAEQGDTALTPATRRLLERVAGDPLYWKDEVNIARTILAPETRAELPASASLP